MRTHILIAALALALAGSAGAVAPALAAPCKDAKGKFIKCPTAPKPKAGPCKDSKGKFIKCAASH